MLRMTLPSSGDVFLVLSLVLSISILVLVPPAHAFITAVEQDFPQSILKDSATRTEPLFPIPIPGAQQSFPKLVTTLVDDVVFSIGFQVAQMRMKEGSDILPLVVGLQNFKPESSSNHIPIEFDDFQLYDEDGHLINPVTIEVIRMQYKNNIDDYEYITTARIIHNILPNVDIPGDANPKFDAGFSRQMSHYYSDSFFYPDISSHPLTRSTTLPHKYFLYDILYYKGIEGKWLRLVIPSKMNRPAMELVFRVDPGK